MRPLPLNAAAASGVTPDAPGQVRIGLLRKQGGDGGLPFVLGRGIKRGRAFEIARIDRRAFRKEELDQRHMPRARGARQRHGAETVAGLERSAGFEQAAGERHTAGIGRREQHQVELRRGGVGLAQVEPAFKFAAGRTAHHVRRRRLRGAAPSGRRRRAQQIGSSDVWNSSGTRPANMVSCSAKHCPDHRPLGDASRSRRPLDDAADEADNSSRHVH